LFRNEGPLALMDAYWRAANYLSVGQIDLLREKHVMRYAAADDFGLPTTAFLIFRFWLVDTWWSLGRREGGS